MVNKERNIRENQKEIESIKFRSFLNFMTHVSDLKSEPRKGWMDAGIEHGESVADHTFGMHALALQFPPLLVLEDNPMVDENKISKMITVHDLAEQITGDKTPYDYVSEKEKNNLERTALERILKGMDSRIELILIFDEYNERKTPEARYVKILDQLEKMFQAYKYGIENPKVNLEDFWENTKDFNFEKLQCIYDNLSLLHSKIKQLKLRDSK